MRTGAADCQISRSDPKVPKSHRRHKIAYAPGAAVVTALMLGAGVSTWHALEAQAAYETADAALERERKQRHEAETARTQAAGHTHPPGDHFRLWQLPGFGTADDLRPDVQEPPGSAAFTSDGKHLVAGLIDGQIVVWEVATGRTIQTRTGHAVGWIKSLTMTAEGRHFATAAADRAIILWDTASYEPLAHFRGHTSDIRYLRRFLNHELHREITVRREARLMSASFPRVLAGRRRHHPGEKTG
jgi:hypothetical protein